jgi:hypothetical protein
MANDLELSKEYGNNKNLFAKNKAEIDLEHISYFISTIKKESDDAGNYVIINNPYHLKIRTEKLLSEIIGISRAQVSLLLKEERIIPSHSPNSKDVYCFNLYLEQFS